MKPPPRVSIILPTYNGAASISTAITSVLTQSYTDFELIIINDASTDTTAQVLADWAQKDSRILVITNPQNLKLVATLNRALQYAKGTYIARIDDDDVWVDSHKLDVQVSRLDQDPSLVLIGTQFATIDGSGNIMRPGFFFGKDAKIRQTLLLDNPFGHSTVLWRGSAITRGYSYDEHFTYCEDLELWLYLGTKGQFEILEQTMVQYQSRYGMSKSTNGWQKAKNHLRIVLRYAGSYPLPVMKLLKLFAFYLWHR